MSDAPAQERRSRIVALSVIKYFVVGSFTCNFRSEYGPANRLFAFESNLESNLFNSNEYSLLKSVTTKKQKRCAKLHIPHYNTQTH